MKRRTILQTIPGLAALGLVGGRSLAIAQDATPTADAGIPPIRWNLVSIDSADDSLVPTDPLLFQLQFFPEGQIGIKADCNVGGGSYAIDGESIAITDVFTTLAFCGDESRDQAFLLAVQAATTWSISNDPGDQLSLNLDEDGSRVLLDPALQGVVWEWQEFLGGDDSVITPDAPERYTLEFLDDWSVQIQADCNTGRGTATVDGSSIEMLIGVTRKMCPEGSFSSDYLRILDEAREWIVSGGDLYLNLPMDAGGARFSAVPPTFGEDATPEP